MVCRNYITSTIQTCWRHTSVLSISIKKQIEEGRLLVEVDEIATLLHQLTMLSYDSEVGDVMNVHEYLNYEMEFDLNNPYEPTDEEFWIRIPRNIKKLMLMRLWLM